MDLYGDIKMSKTWFQSDFHLNHKNIIRYCKRPFQTVEQMNETIIKRHNERVKDDDTIYFLGDLMFHASKNKAFRGEGKPSNFDDFIKKFNGKQWYFIKGNHDKKGNKFQPKSEVIILKQNGLRIQLIHDSQYANIDYDLTLCGHHHNAFKVKEFFYMGKTGLIINCSCDVWNFYPIELNEILSIYYRWKNQREKIQRWETPAIIKELNKGTLAENK